MTSRLAVQVASNLIASVIVVIVGAIVHGLTLNIGPYLLVLAVAVLGAAVFPVTGQAVVGWFIPPAPSTRSAGSS